MLRHVSNQERLCNEIWGTFQPEGQLAFFEQVILPT